MSSIYKWSRKKESPNNKNRQPESESDILTPFTADDDGEFNVLKIDESDIEREPKKAPAKETPAASEPMKDTAGMAATRKLKDIEADEILQGFTGTPEELREKISEVIEAEEERAIAEEASEAENEPAQEEGDVTRVFSVKDMEEIEKGTEKEEKTHVFSKEESDLINGIDSASGVGEAPGPASPIDMERSLLDEELRRMFGDEDLEGKKKKKKGRKKKNKNEEITPIDIESDMNPARETEAEAPAADPGEEKIRLPDQEPFMDEPKKKKVKKEEDFDNYLQTEEISETLKHKHKKALLSLVGISVMAVIMLWLESSFYSNLPHPEFLMPGKYGRAFMLVDLQVLIISFFFVFESFIKGAKKLFCGTPDHNSVPFLLFLFAAIHALYNISVNPTAENTMLYSTVAVFSAFGISLYGYLENRRIMKAFSIVSSPKTKLCLTKIDGESRDKAVFDEVLPENSEIFTVTKTDFAGDFFRRNNNEAAVVATYKILIPAVLILSLITGVYFTFARDITSGLNAFILSVMMSFPISGFFASSLPLFRQQVISGRHDSAILGPESVKECGGVSAISFRDTSVFSPKNVRITSIRTYGDYRIDHTILAAAQVFRKVGGPLAEVFSNSISGISVEGEEDVQLLEIAESGICAKIGKQEIYIGRREYMLSYEFGFVMDDIDDSFEESGGRILYLAYDNEIAAKFYLKYSLGKSFENVIRNLYHNGICAGIKTADPNIDMELLSILLKRRNLSVLVIRDSLAAGIDPTEKTASGGIVSGGGLISMLRTVIACDKLRVTEKINKVAGIISVIVGIVMAAYAMLNGVSPVSSFQVLAYQLIWMIPILATTLFGG